MMRLVMLTGQGYEHCYVANRLADAFPLTHIIEDRSRHLTAVERVRRLRRRYTAGELLSRAAVRLLAVICRDRIHRREAMYRVLGRENCERHLHEGLIAYVDGINSAGSLEILRNLQPDVLLIYGTAVAGDNVLALASQLALNMHTGMSPYYRGPAVRSGLCITASRSGWGSRFTSVRLASMVVRFTGWDRHLRRQRMTCSPFLPVA